MLEFIQNPGETVWHASSLPARAIDWLASGWQQVFVPGTAVLRGFSPDWSRWLVACCAESGRLRGKCSLAASDSHTRQAVTHNFVSSVNFEHVWLKIRTARRSLALRSDIHATPD